MWKKRSPFLVKKWKMKPCAQRVFRFQNDRSSRPNLPSTWEPGLPHGVRVPRSQWKWTIGMLVEPFSSRSHVKGTIFITWRVPALLTSREKLRVHRISLLVEDILLYEKVVF